MTHSVPQGLCNPLMKWENWGTEGMADMPKITQPVRGRGWARLKTHCLWIASASIREGGTWAFRDGQGVRKWKEGEVLPFNISEKEEAAGYQEERLSFESWDFSWSGGTGKVLQFFMVCLLTYKGLKPLCRVTGNIWWHKQMLMSTAVVGCTKWCSKSIWQGGRGDGMARHKRVWRMVGTEKGYVGTDFQWGSEDTLSVGGGRVRGQGTGLGKGPWPQLVFMSMHAPGTGSVLPESLLLTLGESSEGFAPALFHTLQSKYPVQGLRSLRKQIPCCT